MTEFSFPNVTVASSGGEYFQVSFADKEDSDDAYFLIQRQFESPDRGYVYTESHQRIIAQARTEFAPTHRPPCDTTSPTCDANRVEQVSAHLAFRHMS
jgi:hypothetical protein